MEVLAQYVDAMIGSSPAITHSQLEALLRCLPTAAYTCDAEGRLTFFNEPAERLWGRAPKLRDPSELFCGAHVLHHANGYPMDRREGWLAQAMRDHKSYLGREMTVERPDGQRITVNAHAHPLYDEASQLRGGVNFLWEKSDHHPLSQAVCSLTQNLSSREGIDFFTHLAANLCQVCGVAYGVIVSFSSDKPLIGSTLAFARGGSQLPNVEYDIRGTPCENVHRGEFCHYDSALREQFPSDAMLLELGIDAYMGLPLFSSSGKVIGLIALLHEKRIPDPSSAEALIRIVGSRAAAELERRQIEAALRSQQVRFSSVFENASDAVFLLDSTATIIDVNRQACLSLGYDRQELIGARPLMFDPDFTEEKLAALLRQQQSGELITFETRHQRKDGVIFPVEIRLQYFRQEGMRFAVAVVADLRERRAAAAALRAAQQRLELVLDASQIGFWEWDASTERITFSDQWRRQLGYTEADAPATAEFWSGRIHPDDFPIVASTLQAMKTSGLDTHQAELRIRRVDSGWRWIQLRIKAFRDARGALTRVVGLHLDDTPRKRAEIAQEHQKSILERIAKGESLPTVLEAIVDYVESQVVECRCSIMLLRGERLWFAAGKRLPREYCQAIDGVQIGPNVGSCGSAAYRGKTVVVSDIAADPLWEGFRECPLGFGLRSCWSVPIFAGKVTGAAESFGNVLGTFAIYGDTRARPTTEDFEVVGNASYLAGIAIERAKSEEVLRDSESRLTAVIANSPGVAIQFYDAQQRVVLWNHASEEIFGISEGEALGHTLEELTQIPEDAERFRQACVQIAETGLPIGPREFAFHRKDGRQGIALSTQFAIPGPRGESWHACMDVDITERKNSEEAVRQAKEMLQLILDNIPQGVIWKDRQSRYLGMNATVRRAVGMQRGEEVGKSDFDFSSFTMEQAEFYREKDRQVMESDQPQYQIVEPMNVAGGQTVWLNTNKIPLHDAEGKVNGVLVTWEDFTEKRRSQELLQRSMTLLRKTQSMAKMSGWSYDIATKMFSNADEASRILPERASEMSTEKFTGLVHPDDRAKVAALWSKGLAGEPVEMEHRMYVGGDLRWIAIRAEPQRNEAGELVCILGVAQDITDRKRLETQLLQSQKYEGLGVLAGGIAHEFNNILTSVLGNAELGLMHSPAESPSAPIFSEIGKAARRAAALTRQMLAYSGRGQMQIAALQLEAIVQDAAPVLNSIAAGHASLVLQLDSAPVAGDAIQLRLVLLQLVSNAAEALEGQHGQIRIATGEVSLSEADLAREYALPPSGVGDFSFLEVTDNGCGMSEEVVGKIFDPFFSTKFTGRGLGLAAVLGIIKRHLGAVQVRTSVGSGTSLRVLLPKSIVPTNVDAATPAPPPAKHPQSILLIEDEATVREFLTQLLQGAGYRVVTARDGVEGVELAQQNAGEFNLVLLDLLMPRLDGWSVIGCLRKMSPEVPIIAMSGNDEGAEASARPESMRADAFLAKPFRPHQLFAAIKQVLSKAPAL